MKKLKTFDVFAIISTLGIMLWIITDSFGGMFIYLLEYSYIIIPLILLYIVSIINTIFLLIRKGFRNNQIKLISHSLLIVFILFINLQESDLFKSKKILQGTMVDDHFDYTLIFRENGSCENEINGMFGYHKIYQGRYRLQGDTIFFQKIPYDNAVQFIPDTILIDRQQKALFIEKDSSGNFNTKKEWLNYFKME